MEHMQDMFFGHLRVMDGQLQYKEKVKAFILQCKRMQVEHTTLLEVGILFVFREQEELLKGVFPDIYLKYQDTSFLVNKLNSEDRSYITKVYIDYLEKLGKEINDAI